MFLLGRFYKVKGPGLVVIIPGIQKMVRVDLRIVVMDVPSQDVISRDNVSVKVSAVIYCRVVDPQKSIIQVENFLAATSQFAQTTLRSVLGKHELDEMLAEREKLNIDIQEVLDIQTTLGASKSPMLRSSMWILRIDDTRHCPPSGGRARAARKGNTCRRRTSGIRKIDEGGPNPITARRGRAAPLSADPHDYRR